MRILWNVCYQFSHLRESVSFCIFSKEIYIAFRRGIKKLVSFATLILGLTIVGFLSNLILTLLDRKEMYGYEIVKEIEKNSDGIFIQFSVFSYTQESSFL
ncbi:helix-turn-helix transcriptional regulator [Brevibacillus laterosporus]|uniref:Helix-turn-helix transcriptional regulator n=1 Tax=Brevibacillus laterosporus TaxID=1465 RepID=A0AAP3G866_BRELA|nr:helix-turn-helix transcriptional regulator [Brevibacillus laterosporus]MCZ0808278.1 helix-turn-helix transcriptional regulator [Brevibacillus laterosporus]MCZ0826637.1 helix-turn-helix transcriptional regulator [Brevibacillus laterosporus]MCZ0850450.1 helix-turn-helix transcriptional regulator [Brevibacillus laterosporus]